MGVTRQYGKGMGKVSPWWVVVNANITNVGTEKLRNSPCKLCSDGNHSRRLNCRAIDIKLSINGLTVCVWAPLCLCSADWTHQKLQFFWVFFSLLFLFRLLPSLCTHLWTRLILLSLYLPVTFDWHWALSVWFSVRLRGCL